jgi:hypothetical protein
MKEKKLKVFLACWTILPDGRGSSFVTEKLAKNFSREELVVFGSYRTFFGSKKKKRPDAMPKFYYQRSEINIMGRGDRFFSIFRWLLFPFVLLRMNWVFHREKCNYVIGIFPDNFYCLAAMLVAKWNGVGFSSYFHNTYSNARKGFNYRFAKWIEPKIFEASDYIYSMSEGMNDFYIDYFPQYAEKFKPLVHTFDAYPNVPSYKFEQKDKYKLFLIGNFNESNQEATSRFFEYLKGQKQFEIHLFTKVPPILLRQRGIDTSHIIHHGFVPEDIFFQELAKCDIAVLTHGFGGNYTDVEYKTIFPTRTLTLLLTNKPLFAHIPPQSFIDVFLKRHKCAKVVSTPKKEDVLNALNHLITDASYQKSIVDNAQSVLSKYYGKNVVNTLKQQLEKKRL